MAILKKKKMLTRNYWALPLVFKVALFSVFGQNNSFALFLLLIFLTSLEWEKTAATLLQQ